MGRKRRLADVPMPPPDQEFLTRLEACRVARIGTTTFDKAVAAKRITVRWKGTHIVVERAEMVRYVKSLPTERQNDRP
jgi:hypothetical protein